jgi:hypothetical protein
MEIFTKVKRVLFILLLLFISNSVSAQVAINENGSEPHSSAILDVSSDSKGLLIPRLTKTQRNSLATLATDGLLVYDKDLKTFFIFKNGDWHDISLDNLWSRNYSRTYVTNLNDNIGIGTTLPTRKLEVVGNWKTARLSSNDPGAYLEFSSSNSTNWAFGTWQGCARIGSSTNNFESISDEFDFTTSYFRSITPKFLGIPSSRWTNFYSIDGAFSGKVGIGVDIPKGSLQVTDPYNNITWAYITSNSINDSAALYFGEGANPNYGIYWLYDGDNNVMELWGVSTTNHLGPHITIKRNSGDISIGSRDFANGYKLSVAGKIMSEGVTVKIRSEWPDYVFGKKYKLMALSDLESFIKTNGHLPNIPNAKDVAKSGVDLAEMQRLLLEKIEELSLYIIHQQKEIEFLKDEINKIKTK